MHVCPNCGYLPKKASRKKKPIRFSICMESRKPVIKPQTKEISTMKLTYSTGKRSKYLISRFI